MRTPQPTKPLDCFTQEQKLWVIEKIKTDLPEAWERLVKRQAHNMELYTPSEDEKAKWTLDQVMESRLLDSFPFDFGDDGWESSRKHIIFRAYTEAALAERKTPLFEG